MPRPTLFDHPKFHRLVHVLRMPEPHVLGHLEYLWRVGYSAGNPVIGDSLDVELAAKWVGEPGVLTQALVAVRLLDALDGDHFQIHDLYANAPDYVKSRARMERWREKASGSLRNGSDESVQPIRNGYGSHSADQTGTDQNEIKSVSAAPRTGATPAAAHDDAVLVFSTVGTRGDGTWRLTARQVADWRRLYPGVDVLAEAQKALAWLDANPGRRKTHSGMPRFLVNWLNRATDRPTAAGVGSGPRPAGSGRTTAAQTTIDTIRRMEARDAATR